MVKIKENEFEPSPIFSPKIFPIYEKKGEENHKQQFFKDSFEVLDRVLLRILKE